MNFVLVKADGSVSLLKDPISAYLEKAYNPAAGDKVYQLGSQYVIDINLKPVPAKRDGNANTRGL